MSAENSPLADLQADLRKLTREFCEKNLKPRVLEDEASEIFRPENIRALGELGLTGVAAPEAFGGSGLGYEAYAVVIEEIARIHCAYAISVAVSGLPQIILAQFGTSEQKEKWIRPLAEGKWVGAFSLSEAGSGSDAASLKTTAIKKGADYVLNGTKLWTTQADSADIILVMARTGAAGPKGISTFAVLKNTPGVSFGKREKKMGLHASHTMEVIFENCVIPEANRVGAEGDGFKIAMQALDSGRITIAATALGVARGALEVTIAHLKAREQFGEALATFQGLRFQMADLYSEFARARLAVNEAARRKDTGLSYSLEAALAKLSATDMAMKVASECVQLMGGSGYTQDFPVERYMREAKVLQIVEGTNQIQKLVIAKHLFEMETL